MEVFSAGPPGAVPAVLGRHDAERKVAQLLDGNYAPYAIGGKVTVTTDELNRYLERVAGRVEAVDQVQVEVGRGHVISSVVVQPQVLGARYLDDMPEAFLAAPMTLAVEHGLGTSSGFVQWTFRSARVGPLPLPRAFVEPIVAQFLGGGQPVPLSGRMPLPRGLAGLSLEDGQLVLTVASSTEGS